MRTTVDLPDELFRKAKVHAALQGRSLKELVADGLSLVLQSGTDAPLPAASRRTEFPIIKTQDPARKLTPEMVEDAEKRLLEEEAASHARFTGH